MDDSFFFNDFVKSTLSIVLRQLVTKDTKNNQPILFATEEASFNSAVAYAAYQYSHANAQGPFHVASEAVIERHGRAGRSDLIWLHDDSFLYIELKGLTYGYDSIEGDIRRVASAFSTAKRQVESTDIDSSAPWYLAKKDSREPFSVQHYKVALIPHFIQRDVQDAHKFADLDAIMSAFQSEMKKHESTSRVNIHKFDLPDDAVAAYNYDRKNGVYSKHVSVSDCILYWTAQPAGSNPE